MIQDPSKSRCFAAAALTGALLATGSGVWAQDAAPPAAGLSTAPPSTAPAEAVPTTKGGPQNPKARAVQPPTAMVVPAGRNAIDLALEQVPAGVSVEQFLVALFRLNPGAFVEGKLHQLSAGAHLQLPTVEQARALNQERARAELQALRQAALAPPPPPGAAADAPVAAGANTNAADAQGGAPQAAGADPSPPATAPAAAPGPAQASALPIHPWLLISSGAALLTLLFLAFRPSERPSKRPAAPEASAANSAPLPRQDSVSTAAKPKSLTDFGPLPSLDLDEKPASDSARPAPQTPAPFDLSRISLDLRPEDQRPS